MKLNELHPAQGAKRNKRRVGRGAGFRLGQNLRPGAKGSESPLRRRCAAGF